MSLEVPREESESFDRFICPCRILLSGSTNCGKSFFVKRLIEHRDKLFSCKEFERVLFVIPENTRHQRSEYLDSLEEVCDGLEVIQGFPDNLSKLNLIGDESPKLIVIDDLMGEFH